MKNKKTAIAVAVALVAVLVFVGGQSLLGLFTNGNNTTNTQTIVPQQTQGPQQPEVQATDVTVGTGTVAVAGDSVTVNYVGAFTDGTVFDSSLAAGRTPFTFTLGAGQVIKGWDIGVEGMKVGGTRTLVIPPELGYGATAYGPIPASSTLVFQVQLLSVN